MAMTLEEKIALINKKRKNDPSVAERKARKKAKLLEVDAKKKSHDWASVWVNHPGPFGGIGSGGHRQATHCKKCRCNYIQFKINPEFCEKAEKTSDSENTAE